jgi:hypothetical protein
MTPKRTLRVEACEERVVPAQFGVPWHDPSRLSLSLAPDGAAIASHGSELGSALDAQDPTGGWRETILRAYQSWAVYANLNFAFVADEGQAFGAAGLTQGDPRFGDIRVGAHAMSPEVLAVAVPPDVALSGTLSGDVLLNSAYQFDGDPYSLLAVMLHEAGHSLGLGNSDNADSVMYTRYNATRTGLSAEDIARIQALYGARAPDAYEGALGNNTRGRASAFLLPAGYKGETPLVVFGDVTTPTDVDFYRVSFPDDGNDDQNQGELTIRLQTAGKSLLMPRLTVLDSAGRRLAFRASASLTGDVLQVKLTGLSTSGTYYVKVQAATGDVFGVGRYGLSVRFDKTSGVSDELIDKLLRGPFEGLGPDAIDAFFRNSGDVLFHEEEGANDTVATATPLAASAGYAANTRFEAVASLGKKEDVDVYRLTAPAAGGVLTATVWTPSDKGFQPKVTVLDAQGRPVAATVLAQGDGVSTVQVADTVAGQTYYLRVTLAADPAEDKGNYLVSASFGDIAARLRTFTEGSLNVTRREASSVVYVAQTQLFRLVLTTGAQDPGATVRVTVRDEGGGEVLALAARAGEAAGRGAVLLLPGRYTVTVTIDNPNGPALAYSLRGIGESDPIGPVLSDPTMDPRYTSPPPPPGVPPYYTYPPVTVGYDPSGLPGHVVPGQTGTYPPGYIPPPDLGQYPWVIVTTDPYYWIPLGL